MKVLLAHPGYSFERHYNHYEAVLRLLDSVYGVECHTLVCDRAVFACGYRGGLGQSPETIPHDWQKGCQLCKSKLLNRTQRFCKYAVNLSDWICEQDKEFIEREMAKITSPISTEEILNLEFDGVNIGIDIWQSIQRYLFMGSPEQISFSVGSVAYEYIKSGLTYALVSNKIFKNIDYDLVLTNETAYLDWGIPTRFALKYGVPVMHQNTNVSFRKHLPVRIYKKQEELKMHTFIPLEDELQELYNDPVKFQSYVLCGKEALDNTFKQRESDEIQQKVAMELKEWFRPNRKTVVVFGHVCWDSSITYGDGLFLTFERWLTNTYKVALSVPEVDWIFRLHPNEGKRKSSPILNTLSHLENLQSKYPCEHIRIMDASVSLNTGEMIPFMHAGITALGEVGYELPALGVPCIMACKSGMASKDFTIKPESIDDYIIMLKRIADIVPPTPRQRQLAISYTGVIYDVGRYLDVGGLFEDTRGPLEEIMDPRQIDIWLKNKPANKEFIKRKIEGKLMLSNEHTNESPAMSDVSDSVSIAERLFQQGSFAESENAFCQILAADPGNCRARNGLGTVLWHQNLPNDSIAQFAESLRLEPDNRDATWNIGQILLANGTPISLLSESSLGATESVQAKNGSSSNELVSRQCETKEYPKVIRQACLYKAGLLFEVTNPTEQWRVETLDDEEELLTLLLNELRPDDILYDIGACVGIYGLHAAKKCKQVFSFEPDPGFQKHILRNCEINGISNVSVIPYAVSDKRGKVTLYTDGVAGKSPSLCNRQHQQRVDVEACCIDDIVKNDVLPCPTVIKMDIEGAEFFALKGMKELLSSQNNPRLIFLELHTTFLREFGSNANDVLNLIASGGYKALYKCERDEQIHYIFANSSRFNQAIQKSEKSPAMPDVSDSVSIAERLFQHGRFAESENAFRQILATDPANCRGRNGLGTVLWHQNRPNDAIAQFVESLRIEPDNRDATWNIGQILLANNAIEKAMQLYSAYLKTHPDEQLMAQAVQAIKESQAPSKTIWLVAPDISQAECEDIRKRFSFYMPDRPWDMVKHVAVLPSEVVAGRDTVMLFGDLELVPEQVKKDNKRFYDIDHRRCPVDAWNWARLAGCYSKDSLDKEQTRLRFKSYVDMLRSQGLTKSYLFATGPSLAKAIDKDWSDGYRVVCNTIVRDRELWNHINPHFIVAGDGIYHFGHTALPTAFRRDLKKRLAETNTFFLYPDLFHPIVSRELKEFSHRLVPVPSGGDEAVNKDLSIDFALPGLQNAIGLLLLPLGCTLSKDVYLWGFDGRAPDDKLFWSNSNKHSYTELIPELQKHHSGFFNHFVPTGDTRKYTTLAFGDTLENSISQAERQGCRFTMMHHSWTPVLAKRCLPSMAGAANVV